MNFNDQMKNIVAAWQEVVSEKKKLDPVNDKENDKHFKDRTDKDIDNDGDVDSSDEYLHKRRAATDDAIDGGKKPAKKVKEETDGKVCPKCDGKGCDHCDGKGTHEAYESSCGSVSASKKYKKEAVSHEVHGKGQILDESEEGFDVLFDHGVEFNVPAEQLEGVSSAIKTAKRMGGNMTGAVKKIEKSKKGMSDNPRVQKALQKANEEQEVESVQEGTVAEFEEEIVSSYTDVVKGMRGALQQMWEKAQQGVAGKHQDKFMQNQPQSAKDFADQHDYDKAELVKDDEEGHQDALKIAKAGTQSPMRKGDQKKGDTKIVNPVKGSVQ